MLAVADGYIERVRTSPWGYGKAVYLKLDDGRLAVYAHLDRFTDEIEDLVIDAQLAEMRYSIDIWPEAGAYRVGRGEIVGYSGTTGSSAPHLHFELRDERNRPVNPLRNGLTVPDTTPPVVQFLLFRPVGPESRLEENIRVRRFGLTSAGRNTYRLRGRPEVEGTVALGVAAYDQMDGVWNRFSPYHLRLEIDGAEVFEVRYDRFSYLHSGLIALDRDYRYMIKEGSRAHTLYRQTGNELTFYGDYEQGAGYLADLEPGVHRIRVTVADANGNEVAVEGEILWNRRPDISMVESGRDLSEGSNQIVARVTDPDDDPLHVMFEAMRAGGDVAERSSRSTTWLPLPNDTVRSEESLFALEPATFDSLSSEGGWLVRLNARDRWGSEAVSAPIPLGDVTVPRPGGLSLSIDRYEGFLELTARSARAVPASAEFTVEQGELDPVTLSAIQVGPDRYEAIYPLRIAHDSRLRVTARLRLPDGRSEEASALRSYFSIPAGESSRFASSDTGLQALFPAGAVYQDHWIEEAPSTPAMNTVEQGLIPLSRVCDLGPQDILFRTGGELTMPVGDLPAFVRPEQVGLYTHNGADDDDENGHRWFWLGGELDGDLVRGEISGFGPFAVLADTTRPELRLLSPRDGAVLTSGRPRIQFELDDAASGISDESQIVLRLNGSRIVPQYDPQRDRLSWRPREPLEPGEYWLQLEVTDGAGNTGRINTRFTIQSHDHGR